MCITPCTFTTPGIGIQTYGSRRPPVPGKLPFPYCGFQQPGVSVDRAPSALESRSCDRPTRAIKTDIVLGIRTSVDELPEFETGGIN